jgi:hypothetical protein
MDFTDLRLVVQLRRSLLAAELASAQTVLARASTTELNSRARQIAHPTNYYLPITNY